MSILDGGRMVLWRMEGCGWGGGLVIPDPRRALLGVGLRVDVLFELQGL